MGHCRPDGFFLRSSVKRSLPGVEVQSVNSEAGLAEALPTAKLALVNRVLDGRFDSAGGIELIRRLAGDPSHKAALMLISNYPEAQAQAEQAGAAPGFGKSQANTDETRARLAAAIPLDGGE